MKSKRKSENPDKIFPEIIKYFAGILVWGIIDVNNASQWGQIISLHLAPFE